MTFYKLNSFNGTTLIISNEKDSHAIQVSEIRRVRLSFIEVYDRNEGVSHINNLGVSVGQKDYYLVGEPSRLKNIHINLKKRLVQKNILDQKKKKGEQNVQTI